MNINYTVDTVSLFDSNKPQLLNYLLNHQNVNLDELRKFLSSSKREEEFKLFIIEYFQMLLSKLKSKNNLNSFGLLLDSNVNNLDKFFTRPLVEQILKSLYIRNFNEQLADDIVQKKDIQLEGYIDRFLTNFCREYGVSERYINLWGMRGQLKKKFFPTDDFHSLKSRKDRSIINGNSFYKTYNRITEAFVEGQTVIEHSDAEKAKFDSGDPVERTFFDELNRYFGKHFDVRQKVKVKQPNAASHEVDIVICKKDSFFDEINEIDVKNVFAAFEVKRSLTRNHLKEGTKEHFDLFHTKCSELKRGAMPIDCNNLTPYQALNGKLFVGVLATDIYNENKLYEKEFYQSLYSKLTYKQLGSEAEGFRETLLPDFIYVLNNKKKLDIASIKGSEALSFSSVFRQFGVLDHQRQCIDSSVSTFGCLLKQIINFFVGNGYINQDHPLVERFRCFGAIEGELTISFAVATYLRPQHFGELDSYLHSKVPNEYSSIALTEREPLQILSSWSKYSIPDKLYNFIKRQLKTILKHEERNNQGPASDIDLSKTSFDSIFRTLLKG